MDESTGGDLAVFGAEGGIGDELSSGGGWGGEGEQGGGGCDSCEVGDRTHKFTRTQWGRSRRGDRHYRLLSHTGSILRKAAGKFCEGPAPSISAISEVGPEASPKDWLGRAQSSGGLAALRLEPRTQPGEKELAD